jgi:hypothetical protein
MNVGILDDLKIVVIHEVVEKGIYVRQETEEKQNEKRYCFPPVFRRRPTTKIPTYSHWEMLLE